MKTSEINIRGNAEYCGETWSMYLKKNHVHLTKGKLWFAWFATHGLITI